MKLEIQLYYEKICREIIQLNQHIRFVKIINTNGRIIVGAVKDKITFFVEGKNEETLYMEVALRTKMLGDFDPFLGSMNFSIYNRKNVIVMEFPIENAIVYVSSEKEIDLNDVPFMIMHLLEK